MRVFVAGATGAIGRLIIPALLDAGHDVVGMTSHQSGVGLLESMGAGAEVADALDRDAVASAVKRARPGAIIHELTSLKGGDYGATARLRREGSRNLVDAATSAGVKTMVAQSYCIYAPGVGAAKEDEPLDFGPDSRTSAEGILALEKSVSEMPMHVILRYGTLYGPGTGYALKGPMAAQVREGKVIQTDDVTSFVHIRDAARAALLGLSWSSVTVNIVDDEPAPGTSWLPEYSSLIGAPPPPTGGASGHPRRGASNEKARRMLHWEPIHPTWREGFRTDMG